MKSIRRDVSLSSSTAVFCDCACYIEPFFFSLYTYVYFVFFYLLFIDEKNFRSFDFVKEEKKRKHQTHSKNKSFRFSLLFALLEAKVFLLVVEGRTDCQQNRILLVDGEEKNEDFSYH